MRKFDPLVLRQGLRQLGPVTQDKSNTAYVWRCANRWWAGPRRKSGSNHGFRRTVFAKFSSSHSIRGRENCHPDLVADVSSPNSIIRNADAPDNSKSPIECVVENLEHSFPSIEPFTSEIPTLRLYVNTLDIVREFRILSILLLVTEGDDLLAHLEYDGQTSGDLSIEVRTPLGDTKARVEACLAPGGNSGKPMKITIALRHLVPLVQWDLAKPMELTFFERQFDKDRVRRRLMLTQDTGDDLISVRVDIAGRSPF